MKKRVNENTGYYKMGKIEFKFATIIWENEPLRSSELARLALEQLDWKKSTSYTVLKKLSDKGYFQNDKGTVTSIVSRDEYYSMQVQGILDEGYEGSLPKFIAAFSKSKSYTDKEINELVDLIKGKK
ncbi:MAG: BlaI/MecI/CopY family transcriptional regulator [Lachnospiraceae bacterium]|nr:BlaI/MecI/CopY family transcriptional regulator [Lachnospiraceae bacterium]